jgi:uncharacterized protein
MTAPPGYELSIITITVGDDFGATRTMNDIPNGQALAQATWTVKRLEDFAAPGDATAVWQKTITTADVANTGQIEDSGAITRVARLRWDGTYLESLLLIPGREYVYDMQVVSTAGKQFTMERGMLVAYGEVTQS